MNRRHPEAAGFPSFRHGFVLALFAALALALLARAAWLHLFDSDFLMREGDARIVREVPIEVRRGMLQDRFGEPLAISAQVFVVGAEPKVLLTAAPEKLEQLAVRLDLSPDRLRQRLKNNIKRKFYYLKRRVEPTLRNSIVAMNLPGLATRQEHRRYYPSHEVAAQLIGFTNIDDVGEEGLEKQFNELLQGKRGRKRVLKDRLGRIVQDVENVRQPVPGRDIRLTLDRRLQYLAYRELKAAVHNAGAVAGVLVMLDPATGELLAVANQPSYNPNNPQQISNRYQRNFAMVDLYEPGSTIKPFTMLAALLSGKYSLSTTIDTSPGKMKLGRYTVTDFRNYGVLNLTEILKKSSNVGISKIGLSLSPELLWTVLDKFGFGNSTGSGFPGEKSGKLAGFDDWTQLSQATISYGYGMAVSAVQLARAYTILATNGLVRPISLRLGQWRGHPFKRVFPEAEILAVRSMLEEVVQPTGTGKRAAVARYRIAGKTGTVRKNIGHGYEENKYRAMFVGMAPASNPRLVMAVIIDEPSGEEYYGGQIAAPIFAEVMANSLRLLNVPPDNAHEFEHVRIGGIGGKADGGAG